MTLSKAQRGVVLGMATGLVASLVGLILAARLVPLAGALADRYQLLVFCFLGPAVALAVCVARLASHRFRTPQDLDGSALTAGSERARLLQALLQNTLEQLALALPAYAAWAFLAPTRLVAALAGGATLFVVGRVLFFWGYERGAPGRALGFALTFYPTIVLLVGALVFAVRVAVS